MTYRVTAPYVTCEVVTDQGRTVLGFYENALLPDGADAANVAKLVRKGMVEKLEPAEQKAVDKQQSEAEAAKQQEAADAEAAKQGEAELAEAEKAAAAEKATEKAESDKAAAAKAKPAK
jgi:colicin import membrane protein